MNNTTSVQILRLAEQQTHLEKRQADALDRLAAAQERQADAHEKMADALTKLAECIDLYDAHGVRRIKTDKIGFFRTK